MGSITQQEQLYTVIGVPTAGMLKIDGDSCVLGWLLRVAKDAEEWNCEVEWKKLADPFSELTFPVMTAKVSGTSDDESVELVRPMFELENRMMIAHAEDTSISHPGRSRARAGTGPGPGRSRGGAEAGAGPPGRGQSRAKKRET